MSTLLTPVTTQDLDDDLAKAAQVVTEGAVLLSEMANWALNILIPENLDDDMLIVLGGAEPRLLTQEEMDKYRLYFGQVGMIAALLAEGNPPATGLVLPWLQAFRSGSTIIRRSTTLTPGM